MGIGDIDTRSRELDTLNRANCAKVEANRITYAWRRACQEIINKCVTPDMSVEANAMLDQAVRAFLESELSLIDDYWAQRRAAMSSDDSR